MTLRRSSFYGLMTITSSSFDRFVTVAPSLFDDRHFVVIWRFDDRHFIVIWRFHDRHVIVIWQFDDRHVIVIWRFHDRLIIVIWRFHDRQARTTSAKISAVFYIHGYEKYASRHTSHGATSFGLWKSKYTVHGLLTNFYRATDLDESAVVCERRKYGDSLLRMRRFHIRQL